MIYLQCKSIILSPAEWKSEGRGPKDGRKPEVVIKRELTAAWAKVVVSSRGSKKC